MNDRDDSAHSGSKRRRSLSNPLGRLMGAVVPNVVDAIDVDEVVAQVDLDALLARVDLDEVLSRVDLDALLSRVDVNALAGRIDVDAFLARVDVNSFLERVDVNALLSRVDVDAFLAHVDVDALARRLDLDELVGRVDVDAIVGSVDIDAVLARIDLDAVIDRVDVDHVMQRADVAGIVARSTRGMTARTLDLARRQLVGIDEIITRLAARIARRDPDADPGAPPALRATEATRHTGPSISGYYAGPLSRMASLSIDMFAVVFLFGVATAVATWTSELLFDRGGDGGLAPPWSTLLFVAWTLTYYIAPTAATGRTLGKAIVGLRVVTRDGGPLHLYQAIVRVLVLPVSFALLGIGLLGAVFGRHRRTLHDLVAGSAEVIDWGDRAAALPTPISNWLARRTDDAPSPDATPAR